MPLFSASLIASRQDFHGRIPQCYWCHTLISCMQLALHFSKPNSCLAYSLYLKHFKHPTPFGLCSLLAERDICALAVYLKAFLRTSLVLLLREYKYIYLVQVNSRLGLLSARVSTATCSFFVGFVRMLFNENLIFPKK